MSLPIEAFAHLMYYTITCLNRNTVYSKECHPVDNVFIEMKLEL